MHTITILNMSHRWFCIIILIKYYTYTWCASKYLKLCKIIMQGQILLSYLFICYIVLLYFFVVKLIKPISMKSNVCNSLNYSAQYVGRHD